MIVEVSDLYDAFFQIAQILWAHGEFDAKDPVTRCIGPSYDEMLDELEIDFFLAACIRRLGKATNHWFRPGQVRRRLKLHGAAGEMLPEPEWRYQGQSFHHEEALEAEIQNSVLAGDLRLRWRSATRIFLHFEEFEEWQARMTTKAHSHGSGPSS